MDTICVPFAIQMEGDDPPDLSGFVDPICVPARIVWVNEDGTPWAPAPTGTAAGENAPSSSAQHGTGITRYARFDHIGEFQPVLDILDTARFVRSVWHLLGIGPATAELPLEEARVSTSERGYAADVSDLGTGLSSPAPTLASAAAEAVQSDALAGSPSEAQFRIQAQTGAGPTKDF